MSTSTTLRLPPKGRLDLTAKKSPAPAKETAQPAKKRTKPGRIPPKVNNAEQKSRKAAEVQERTQREMAEANARRAAARAVNLATLAERFPTVFGNADKPVPLAIGCANEVRAALGMTWSQGVDLMHWWTHRPAYYAALIAGGARYNIDGTENGEVTPLQQAHATKALRRHQNWLARTSSTPQVVRDRDQVG